MNQSLLWGVFAVGLVCCWLCSPEHPCVCSFVWGCPWRGGWAGGTGEQLRVCWECTEQGLCSHAALQSMNSHPGQHPGDCCHSLKGENPAQNPLPKAERSGRPVINALQCAVTETAESCSGRGSQSCQQGGHRLHCQAAFGRMVQPKQLWLSWDAAGAAPDTRSCWIVHWTHRKAPCQVTAQTQSKSLFCFLLIPSERSSLLSHGSVLI